MNIFKEAKLINLLIQNGANIAFEHKDTKKVINFPIKKKGAKMIRKMTHSNKNHYFVVSEKGEYYLLHNKASVCEFLDVADFEFGEVYFIGDVRGYNVAHAVFTRLELLGYIDAAVNNVQVTTTVTNNHDYENYNPVQHKSVVKKPTYTKPVKFKSNKKMDWDEAFLEGMRIFGNRDEAEAYADDEKQKYL